MSAKNKSILLKGNEAITAGDNEGFLNLCTEDTRWEFVGDRVLNGKEEVRTYMKENYLEPPKFNVTNLIAEGDFVTAIGEISMKNKDGELINYHYCDVWKFRGDQIAELRGFVIEKR